MTNRPLTAITLAFLSWTPVHNAATPVGVVTLASVAQIGMASASVGTTIFDGDVLSTEQSGALRLRAGPAAAYLSEKRESRFEGPAMETSST
jgi:hypothetical protein